MAEGQVVINIDGVDNFSPVMRKVTETLTELKTVLPGVVSGLTDLGNDGGALAEELKPLVTRLSAIRKNAQDSADGMLEFAAAIELLGGGDLYRIGAGMEMIAKAIKLIERSAEESADGVVNLAVALELLNEQLMLTLEAAPLAAEALGSAGVGAALTNAEMMALRSSVTTLVASVDSMVVGLGGATAAMLEVAAASVPAATGVRRVRQEVSMAEAASKGLLATMAPLLALFAAFKIVSYMVESEAALETLEGRLNGVSSSTKEAHDRLQELQAMSEKLGVPVEKLGDAYVKLKLAGVDASEGLVKAVVNISAVTGKSVDTVAKLISKASLDATRSLKEFGIAARNEGQEIAVTFHGHSERIGRDQQSIVNYLEKIGNHGYADQAALKANTLGGVFESLKTKTFNLATSFMAETGLSGALKDGMKWMGDLFDSTTRSGGEFMRWGTIVVDVVKIAGNAIGMFVKVAMDALGLLANALRGIFVGLYKVFTEGPKAASDYLKQTLGAMGVNGTNILVHTVEGLSGMGDAAKHGMAALAQDRFEGAAKGDGKDHLGGGHNSTNPYGKEKKDKKANDPDKWMKDLHDPAMMADLKGLRSELDKIGELMLKVKVTSNGVFNAKQLEAFSGEVLKARADFDAAVKEYEKLDAHGATPEAKHKALQMMEQKWAELGKAEEALMKAHYVGITHDVTGLEEKFSLATAMAGYKGGLSFAEGFATVSKAVGATKAQLIADIETLAAQITKAPTEAAKKELQDLLKMLKQVEGMEKTLTEESRRPTNDAIKAAGSQGPKDDNRGRVSAALGLATTEMAGLQAKGSGANEDEKARLVQLQQETAKLQKEARAADKAFGSMGDSIKAKILDMKDGLVSFNDYFTTAVLDGFSKFAEVTANCFGDMIRHSKSAGAAFSDAMKGALKAVAKGFGDLFTAHAVSKFAEGLWPVNPAALAAGAGYMVAAGAMYALAGGGGNSASAGGGGGGAQIDQQRNASQQQTTRTVNVDMKGDWLVVGKNDPASVDVIANLIQQVTGQQTVVHFT